MIKAPIELQELRRRIGAKAKAEHQHRFWGMYVHVCKVETLLASYRHAKANDGAAGSDGVTFEQIEQQGLQEFIAQLAEELCTKSYKPLPPKVVKIPKFGAGERELQIPAIRDRVVQGALRLIMEPIFEADFQPGSFGFRPGRSQVEALEHVRSGLNKMLYHVLDLDLKAYFDTVRHDKLLLKIAKRFADDDILWLSKQILKAAGKQGLGQGSAIGPLWANLYLNEVDCMLEKAQAATRDGKYERIRYARFADDLVVLVSIQPFAAHWQSKVETRLREELDKLDLTVNAEKSQTVRLDKGESFDFLGYTFRLGPDRRDPNRRVVISHPQKRRRTKFLQEVQSLLKRSLHLPIGVVVKSRLNPKIRGWVNYFRWGNAGYDLSYVRWQIDKKVRRFASRKCPKHRGGQTWTKWSRAQIYEQWGLYSDYLVKGPAAKT